MLKVQTFIHADRPSIFSVHKGKKRFYHCCNACRATKPCTGTSTSTIRSNQVVPCLNDCSLCRPPAFSHSSTTVDYVRLCCGTCCRLLNVAGIQQRFVAQCTRKGATKSSRLMTVQKPHTTNRPTLKNLGARQANRMYGLTHHPIGI